MNPIRRPHAAPQLRHPARLIPALGLTLTLVLALALTLLAATASAQGTRADYDRAAGLQALTSGTVFRARVEPHWLPGAANFWYRNNLPGSRREYIMVDAASGQRRPAFDHARLTAALAQTTATRAVAQAGPEHLTLDELDFTTSARALTFRAGGKLWRVDLASYALRPTTAPKASPTRDAAPAPTGRRGGSRGSGRSQRFNRGSGGLSPDGKWTAFFQKENLYISRRASGEIGPTSQTFALSTDGTPGDAYSGVIRWSPDSTRIAVLRTKAAQEHKVTLIHNAPLDQLQPKVRTIDYLKPGDRIAVPKPHLFDVVNRREIPIPDTLFPTPWSIQELRWAPDSTHFTFYYNQRGHQVLRIVAIGAATGAARALVDEQSPTFVDYSGKHFAEYLDDTAELIWMSERSGWNHLYLYDAKTGQVKNPITHGEWVVRRVERVDAAKRQLWFWAGAIRPAQDPYYQHLCRVNFDGTGLVILTEGDGTHTVQFSPDSRWLLDTWSRVDTPPVTELRRAADGSLVATLERADASALLATGWRAPERFVAKGRDGKTDIYGVVWLPMHLDPARKYPVIEYIYAGPQDSFVPKDFKSYYRQQTLTELGFIVVQCDGMGTNNRSKAFHDVCWKNLGDAGFPDRIPWIKAAAQKYPCMDVTRVGIYGTSAGAQSSLRALLAHGDFYKAAMSDSGCHDNRMDKIWWNELWMSWPLGPHYAEQSNVTQAHKLTGKLLLIVGDQDDNVDPASTLQVASALIKADKDFELLVVPGGRHGCGNQPYGWRRTQDFFVKTLLGQEPRRPEK